DPSRNLSADACYLAFELSQTSFVSVLKNNSLERGAADGQMAKRYSMRFHLFWNNMPAGDFNLLFFSVAGQPDDFHTILQSRMHRVEHVGGRHKHHVRQIKRHTEIVVTE